jgi:hypothetical protein
LATGCGPAGVVLVGGRDVVVVRRVVVGDGVVVRCVTVRDGDVMVVGPVVRVAPAPASAAGREPPRWLRPTAARPSRTTATSTIASTWGPRDGRFGGGPGKELVGGGITGATKGDRDQFTGGGVIDGG